VGLRRQDRHRERRKWDDSEDDGGNISTVTIIN
jgi:hypothetical protein